MNGTIVHSTSNKSHLKLRIGIKCGCSGCPSNTTESTCGFDGSNNGWFRVDIVGDSKIK